MFRPHPEAVTEEARERMARLRADLAAHGVRLSRRTLDAVWNFCAVALPLLRERSPMRALDIALARRALPSVLSAAPLSALKALPEMVRTWKNVESFWKAHCLSFQLCYNNR